MDKLLDFGASDFLEDKYDRLRLINWWDQERLSGAVVMVVGAGTIGNELIKNLALLGIGKILIVDMDKIEHSNLTRSVLFRTGDVGRYKAEVAAERAMEINPDVTAKAFTANVIDDIGLGVFRRVDVVLGGLDNREARLGINQACYKMSKPWIDGAIEVLNGIARVFIPPDGACYECTMTETDWKLINKRKSCVLLTHEQIAEGKIPTTPTSSSIIAGIQVQEMLKLLHRDRNLPTLAGKGFVFNGLTHDSYIVEYQYKNGCMSHETYEEILEMPWSAQKTTLAEVLREVKRDLGEKAVIDLDRDIAIAAECSCGAGKELYMPVHKLYGIMTPIWHPNFRDGQICIGDIWGAGESLSDIIINIGDMIQYKSWNSYSPLSAEAAKWAIENKHLFPVGNLNLYQPDYTAAADNFEIDLIDETAASEDHGGPQTQKAASAGVQPSAKQASGETAAEGANELPSGGKTDFTMTDDPPKTQKPAENDFEITAEDLKDIVYVPSAQRMQTLSMHGGVVKGKRINFKTVLVKGILWAFLGAVLAFIVQESLSGLTNSSRFLRRWGYDEVAAYMEKLETMDETSDIDDLNELYDLESQIQIPERELISVVNMAIHLESSFFAAFIALWLGLLMGVGEGVFYGSTEKALKYAGIGAGIALVIGFVSGYIAQSMYSILLSEEASGFASAIVRGIGWSIMGLGVGLSIGLIKLEKKRMLYCTLGGLGGGFLGGFLFDYVYLVVHFGYQDTGIAARAVGIIIMGLLNFFNLPFQVAYVIDPIRNNRGFFQWKNNKVQRLEGFYLFLNPNSDTDSSISIISLKPQT